MLTRYEIAKSAKSLICLLQSLVGEQVQLELRNDTYVMGTLVSVDMNMNTEIHCGHIWSIYHELSKNTTVNHEPDTSPKTFILEAKPNSILSSEPPIDYIFIKGSRIRYFHLGEDVDIVNCIESQLAVFHRRRAPVERPFNWKNYRKKLRLDRLQQQSTSQVNSDETTSFLSIRDQESNDQIN